MLFKYQCREPLNDGDKWHNVDQDDPGAAAEDYAETCNSDGDMTDAFTRGVIIEVRDSDEPNSVMRFNVEVEFSPTYYAREAD